MPTPNRMNMPQPPETADVTAMHRWMVEMYTWHQTITLNGIQAPFYSSEQLAQMSELTQAGKLFFNNDTGKLMVGEVDSGNLVIKTVTTS